MKEISIVSMTKEAWPEVARIYEAGIATQNATFQTEAPTWEYWDKAHRPDCQLIAFANDKIVGWAALSPVSARSVYAGVAEVSIYVDNNQRGLGIGSLLMKKLIEESERNGIWTLQSGIFPENIASIKLHQKHDFRISGIKERIGKMNNTWRDIAMLERRSKTVGID